MPQLEVLQRRHRPQTHSTQKTQPPPAQAWTAPSPAPSTKKPTDPNPPTDQDQLLPPGHLGPLESLLKHQNLTDIYINGPQDIWYETAGKVHRANINLGTEENVRFLATRLINASGKLLDAAHPACDVQTARGHRVHAVLPPVSAGGTAITIRLQPPQRPTLEDLTHQGLCTPLLQSYLHDMVAGRKNFLVSGGTGSGKTTLLNALLGNCRPEERLITIEDTPELDINHPHVLSLTAQSPNNEGQGEISLAELIKQALRMRPSRLILGECRGAEVADMLTAMNTGHNGAGGTLHANSAEAVPARLYALGALAGMSQQALTLQAATAFDCIIHLRHQEGRRYIESISTLELVAGQLRALPVCTVTLGRRGNLLENWENQQKPLPEAGKKET